MKDRSGRLDGRQGLEALEQWKQLPKVELHCHLDGALKPETVQNWLAESGQRMTLEEVTQKLQVPGNCRSLVEYLRCFSLPTQLLDRKARFVQATRDLLEQAEEEGICYLEIRYAPNLHRACLPPQETIEAVLEGIQTARTRNVRAQVLLCLLRGLERTEAEQKQLLDWAVRYRHEGVCGVDLAGDERGYPLEQFEAFFREANRRDLRYTIHAGEAGGPEEVERAIHFGATRVGHGIAAHADPRVLEQLAQKQVLCELCPTSNLQTCAWPEERPYPLVSLVQAGVPCLLNTDNRTVSGTTLSQEWARVQEQDPTIDLGFARARQLEGLEHAFMDESAREQIRQKLTSTSLTNEHPF